MISPNNSSTNTAASPAAFVTREDDGGCHDPDRRRQRQQQYRDFATVPPSVNAGVAVTFVDDGTTTTTAADCGSWPTDTEAAAATGVTDRTPLLCDIDGEVDDVGHGEYKTVNGCLVNVLGENSKYGSVDADEAFMSSSPTMTGGFVRQPSTGSGKLVYCIHGKPSGCCATLVSADDNNSNHQKSDPTDGKSSITIFNEHCHPNRESTTDHQKARRKLIIASTLCLIFMVGEGVGGYMSRSLAIATDASHLLTDFASFMISLFALWVASRPATQSMPFGWYRAEVLGALTSVLLIWVVTGVLLYLAVERITDMSYEIDSKIMLSTSAVGLVVNVIMGLTLHQHSHSHGGVGSHSHEASGQNNANINVRAAYIHVLGDIIQSLGVLVAAIIVYIKPEWKIVDPICTFLFSILVLITTFNILRDTMVVLMEGMPKGVNFVDVLETFMSIDGVVRVHNLRVWALSPDKIALAAHLAVKPGVNTTTVLKEASRRMYKKYNFFDCTLQIEEFDTQMENCIQCQPPKC